MSSPTLGFFTSFINPKLCETHQHSIKYLTSSESPFLGQRGLGSSGSTVQTFALKPTSMGIMRLTSTRARSGTQLVDDGFARGRIVYGYSFEISRGGAETLNFPSLYFSSSFFLGDFISSVSATVYIQMVARARHDAVMSIINKTAVEGLGVREDMERRCWYR